MRLEENIPSTLEKVSPGKGRWKDKDMMKAGILQKEGPDTPSSGEGP